MQVIAVLPQGLEEEGVPLASEVPEAEVLRSCQGSAPGVREEGPRHGHPYFEEALVLGYGRRGALHAAREPDGSLELLPAGGAAHVEEACGGVEPSACGRRPLREAGALEAGRPSVGGVLLAQFCCKVE